MITTNMDNVRGIIIGMHEARDIIISAPISIEGGCRLTTREITIEFENGTRATIELFSHTSDLKLEIES